MIDQDLKRKSKIKKGFEFYYDKQFECFVFEIQDIDGMFPLLVKGPFEKSYELIRTRKGGLQLR